MALIKCPECGHTIASVASKCPRCGAQLSQFRFVQGEGGGLTECRRCSRKVLSGAAVCPHCGVVRPGRRTPYMVVGLLVAFAIPALILATVRDRETARRAASLATEAGPQLLQGVAQAAPPPADVAPVPIEPAAVALAAPAPEPEPVRAAGADSVVTELKWILDWANVREGRALGTRVVRVLRPGAPVQVSDRLAGWWALYDGGRMVGYVAGSLLSDQPPSEGRTPGERVP